MGRTYYDEKMIKGGYHMAQDMMKYNINDFEAILNNKLDGGFKQDNWNTSKL